MASGDLVLLTGSTGFLGYRTLADLLERGYRVRAAVRNLTKAKKIETLPSIKKLGPDVASRLTFVLVTDMTAPGAFDAAVSGAGVGDEPVKYIIHVASPIPSFGEEPIDPAAYDKFFVDAAVAGSVGMLESAARVGKGAVKRVVMTSSIVGMVPFEYFLGQGEPADRLFGADVRIPVAKGPFGFEFAAYSASKAAAVNESEKWIKENGAKAGFDLVSIFPSWIFGRDELVTETTGFGQGSTNSQLMAVLKGEKNEVPYSGNCVLVDDVALVHVLSLDAEKVPGNRGYIMTTGNMLWEDATKYAQKYYPEAFASSTLSTGGKQPTIEINMDFSESEKTFGFKFSGFEEQVKQLAGQYLELAAQA